MSETTYHLYALCQGSRACDASWLLYLSESGRTRTLPYFFWILTPEGGGAPIVIDTGFSEESQKARNPDYADYRPQRELLGHFGIKPSDVETLIVSHLHWDHFMSPRLFTAARFYLQRRELDFWRSDAAEYHFINHFLGDLEEAERLHEAGRLETRGRGGGDRGRRACSLGGRPYAGPPDYPFQDGRAAGRCWPWTRPISTAASNP